MAEWQESKITVWRKDQHCKKKEKLDGSHDVVPFRPRNVLEEKSNGTIRDGVREFSSSEVMTVLGAKALDHLHPRRPTRWCVYLRAMASVVDEDRIAIFDVLVTGDILESFYDAVASRLGVTQVYNAFFGDGEAIHDEVFDPICILNCTREFILG